LMGRHCALFAKNDENKEKLFVELEYEPCGKEITIEFNEYSVAFARFEQKG